MGVDEEERRAEEELENMEQPQPMMNQREKYWAELDTEGKLERMREQVKMLIHKVDHLNDVVSMLQQHTHQDGIMVIPMNASIGGGMDMFGGRRRSQIRPQEDDSVFF